MGVSTRKLFRDDAVVLRTFKLGEADSIVSLLGRERGRFRAVAKGLRRTSSKFGARLAPFGHVDLQLIEGRGELHTVTQAVGLHLPGAAISGDWAAYTAACVIAEAAERLVPEDHQADLDVFQLTLGAFRALAETSLPPVLIMDSYLLRGMKSAGWAPSLKQCASCGTDGEHRAFSVAAGGAVCANCRPGGASVPAPASMELMRALEIGDWSHATTADGRQRSEAAGLIAAHFQWHSERPLRTLKYVPH
ncbi:DNA repair protein RecO [Glycomyces buryatensis]|uniref:DNA repair protein RecO n=1 Tax=Glycomyces buryatensis TaxID=2570927 RepID=A0A4S8QIN6_9ACTN|nr:DNA repair protein RecO [Glycomyces buryatensis]THV43621.1 DNA repair protein RecO [Glycomyces buryatensis]